VWQEKVLEPGVKMQSMMTPIIAVIISIMNARSHPQLRLDAMVMTVGTTERDRMSIVVMRESVQQVLVVQSVTCQELLVT